MSGGKQSTRQPNLFDEASRASPVASAEDDRKLVLWGLGDFQARGKLLVERDLPLDRLRGAFKRAAEKLQIAELDDARLVAALGALGARVKRVPAFVAKHPYRVIVPQSTAAEAATFFRRREESDE